MSHGLDLVVSARSAQRRLGSLARANEVRVERAHLKRALAAGSVAFAEVLANPPPLCAHCQSRRPAAIRPWHRPCQEGPGARAVSDCNHEDYWRTQRSPTRRADRPTRPLNVSRPGTRSLQVPTKGSVVWASVPERPLSCQQPKASGRSRRGFRACRRPQGAWEAGASWGAGARGGRTVRQPPSCFCLRRDRAPGRLRAL
jgi:hypothetical protein